MNGHQRRINRWLGVRIFLEVFWTKVSYPLKTSLGQTLIGEGGCVNLSLTPMLCISAVFGGKKTCFCEENPSRGASVTLLRCFREQIHEDFPPFFTIFCSFFGLQLVSVWIRNFSIHCLFCLLSSSSCSLLIFFSFAFNELFYHLFKSLSRLIIDKMNFNRSFVL